MSHFRTIFMAFVFMWSSLSHASLYEGVEAQTNLKIEIQGRATRLRANGMAEKDALTQAVADLNKEVAPSQRVEVVAENDCALPEFGKSVRKRTLVILFGAAMVCLGAVDATAPTPQPVESVSPGTPTTISVK